MHGGKNQPLAMLVVVHFQSPRHVDSKICATNFAQSLATPFSCDESLAFFSDDFVAANLLCIPDLKVKQLLKKQVCNGSVHAGVARSFLYQSRWLFFGATLYDAATRCQKKGEYRF